LQVTGVDIEKIKLFITQCKAGTKILILDCCHSGEIIDSMGEMRSQIQAGINDFKGTYVMTSSSGKEPSLFPAKEPKRPTYFTGELVNVLDNGLNVDSEFCSFVTFLKK